MPDHVRDATQQPDIFSRIRARRPSGLKSTAGGHPETGTGVPLVCLKLRTSRDKIIIAHRNRRLSVAGPVSPHEEQDSGGASDDAVSRRIRLRTGVRELDMTVDNTDEAKGTAASGSTAAVDKLHDLILEATGVDFDHDVEYADGRSADLGHGTILVNVIDSKTHTIDHVAADGTLTPYDKIDAKLTDANAPSTRGEQYRAARAARDAGYDLLQAYDWTRRDVLVDLVRSKLGLQPRKFYARKCVVKEIRQREANKFLDLYHMQGGAKMQTYCLGLFDPTGSELLQVQTFGKSRFDKTAEWEAIRLATKFGVAIVGGVSRGYARFVRDNDPESVVSYVDFDRSNGRTDEATGFTLERETGPSAFWYKPDGVLGRTAIKDSSLHKLGIDKVLHMPYDAFPDYDGTFENSNTGLMFREGYVRVCTAGNLVYKWTKNQD